MGGQENGISFRFRRNDTVGTADAADDNFLSECFIETGDLTVLRDSSNPKRIIVGRTGAGKTALIRKLKEEEEHVIEVPPQNLSLSYIANSDVLNFFESAGVNLDLFYQVLWRHVLTVELLKYRFRIHNEDQKQSFLASLIPTFKKDKSKEQAIDYLREWGEKFWNETEYRVKEVTTKVESDLKASIGASFSGLKFDAATGKNLSTEQKQEVVHRGSQVVNQIQIKALADVIRLLSEDVFNDPQQIYYLTIDGLDEHWVEETLRYKLIRSLIETIRSFQKIKFVKIIVAIRVDLLNRVIHATKDAGFQEEKYESLYLKLRWSKPQIEELLDRRVNKLVRERYTTRQVKLRELFPKNVGKTAFVDYLVDRTFLRPRDAILFTNLCLEQAENKNQVTAQMVSSAESEYSRKRLSSLQEEWGATYPNLTRYAKILEKREPAFKLGSISKESIADVVYNDFLSETDIEDPVFRAAEECFMEEKRSIHFFLLSVIPILYEVGMVGIKPDSQSGTFWSFKNNEGPSLGSVKPSSMVHIHPTFWRVLGTKAYD